MSLNNYFFLKSITTKSGFLICLLLLVHVNSVAQLLTGRVIDAVTKEPILGASVYLEGTSIGVSTDVQGTFKLDYSSNATAKLVISMLGYDTKEWVRPTELNSDEIMLFPRKQDLEAVVLFSDPWTRARKEAIFKTYFLGKASFLKKCAILNLDKVRLVFNPKTAILTATADVPVLVENKHLGYLIEVDLESINFYYNKLDTTIIRNLNSKNPQVYSLSPYLREGKMTTFFKELDLKRPSVETRIKNRAQLYAKTRLYFYRALCEGRLEEAGFKLFYLGAEVAINDHIKTRPWGDFYHVGFRHDEYVLKDKFSNATIIRPQNPIGIITNNGYRVDDNGAITNRGIFIMNGYLATLGLATAMPSNYSF